MSQNGYGGSGKCPGNSRENARISPRDILEISGTLPRNSREISGRFPGEIPIFREIPGRFLGIVRETFLGHSREMSRKFPGRFGPEVLTL